MQWRPPREHPRGETGLEGELNAGVFYDKLCTDSPP